jgi:hypothetical protein
VRRRLWRLDLQAALTLGNRPWHTGASDLFSGTQVDTIFFNGIQVKASK